MVNDCKILHNICLLRPPVISGILFSKTQKANAQNIGVKVRC